MIKVGIIGTGGMGSVHVNEWKALKDVEIVAVCDVTKEHADRHVEGNIKAYYDYKEMLEKENFDIIDVCTPTYLHKEVSIAAMNKKINVICEKPLALNVDEAKEIYSVAKENDVYFMVAHVIRFWDEYVSLKKIIEEKKYGKLLNMSMWRISAKPKWSWENWMLDEKKSGLIPLDLHIHDLDYMVSVFGAPKSYEMSRGIANKGIDEYTDQINMRYDYDGFYVTSSASWYNCDYPFVAGFRAHFEQAVVEYSNGVLMAYQSDGQSIELNKKLEGEGVGINLPTTNGYANEIIYFKDCVKNNTAPSVIKEQEIYDVLSIVGVK